MAAAERAPSGALPLAGPRGGGIRLDPAEDRELPVIAALAERIWWQAYPPIIGAQQVHYMLGRGYTLPALRAARCDGTRFALYRFGPLPIGFSAWRAEGGRGFLDKLYLLPSLHGHGLGGRLIIET